MKDRNVAHALALSISALTASAKGQANPAKTAGKGRIAKIPMAILNFPCQQGLPTPGHPQTIRRETELMTMLYREMSARERRQKEMMIPGTRGFIETRPREMKDSKKRFQGISR